MEALNNCVVIALDKKETEAILTSLREQVDNPVSKFKNKDITGHIFTKTLLASRRVFGEDFMR
jgi:hypothetical protein